MVVVYARTVHRCVLRLMSLCSLHNEHIGGIHTQYNMGNGHEHGHLPRAGERERHSGAYTNKLYFLYECTQCYERRGDLVALCTGLEKKKKTRAQTRMRRSCLKLNTKPICGECENWNKSRENVRLVRASDERVNLQWTNICARVIRTIWDISQFTSLNRIEMRYSMKRNEWKMQRDGTTRFRFFFFSFLILLRVTAAVATATAAVAARRTAFRLSHATVLCVWVQ